MLTVAGTTNLPDGVWIAYEVTPTNQEVVEVAEGYARVTSGRFAANVSLKGWPAGDVEVWVAFQTVLGDHEQPREILDRYGSLGERLTGSNVSVSGDIHRVETTAVVPFGGS